VYENEKPNGYLELSDVKVWKTKKAGIPMIIRRYLATIVG